jgi:hypothetical protein
MVTHICDRCGRPIEQGQLRYVAKIQVFAAADMLEITLEDLLRDTRKEIDRLLRQCEEFSEEELMRDVFVQFQFDLCRACQRTYIANPMPLAHALGAESEGCPGDQE